jgi:hypothetical protein
MYAAENKLCFVLNATPLLHHNKIAFNWKSFTLQCLPDKLTPLNIIIATAREIAAP